MDGWISSILIIQKGKNNYIAVGCWDGTVKIYSEYNLDREIPKGEYAHTFLSTDDDGEFSFIGYKDGTVVFLNMPNEKNENEENNIKKK